MFRLENEAAPGFYEHITSFGPRGPVVWWWSGKWDEKGKSPQGVVLVTTNGPKGTTVVARQVLLASYIKGLQNPEKFRPLTEEEVRALVGDALFEKFKKKMKEFEDK